MTKIMELTCTVCPTGCEMTVEIENGIPIKVTGNSCKRGEPYAIAEATQPMRTLTTTMRLCNAEKPLISVRSSKPVPRQMLKEIVQVLNGLAISAPVKTGDVLVPDILQLGVDIIATVGSD